MRIRHRMSPLATVAVCLMLAAGAAADPPSIAALAKDNRPRFSEAERASIETYAGFWSQRLGEGRDDPALVRTAQRKLLEPLRVPGGSSPVFRDAYGRALIDDLETLARDPCGHVSVNAAIVMAQLGTEASLETLTDLLRHDTRHVRLAAARGCKDLLGRDLGTLVTARDVMGAARRIRDAAKNEDDAMALRHELAAILAADASSLSGAQRRQVRGYLVEALRATAGRAKDGPADKAGEILDACYPVLVEQRNRFLRLDADAQRHLGALLGPCLGDLLRVVQQHWAGLPEEPAERQQIGLVIRLAEQLLAMIDPIVRGGQSPSTDLQGTWSKDDRLRFDEDLDSWLAVLGQSPPY